MTELSTSTNFSLKISVLLFASFIVELFTLYAKYKPSSNNLSPGTNVLLELPKESYVVDTTLLVA